MSKNKNISPMMQHYLSVKANYPEMLLFYQMGDFFELFYEDAQRAASLLNITLTSRNRDEYIPMAGVPIHAIDNYLAKLLKLDIGVALCEQTGTDEKGNIKREVTRILTAGTVTEEALLNPSEDSILLAIYPQQNQYFLAYLDLSTNRFLLSEGLNEALLASEIERLNPAEILLPDNHKLKLKIASKYRPEWHFSLFDAHKNIAKEFGVLNLSAYAIPENHPALAAASALLQYVKDTNQKLVLNPPKLESRRDYLYLDAVSRRNLEINHALNGDGKKGLFAHINRCCTAAGQRLLRRWLNQPLCQIEAIRARHDAVQSCLCPERFEIRKLLLRFADLERITTRIVMQSARPRELLSLRETLSLFPELLDLIRRIPPLAKYIPQLSASAGAVKLLQSALRDEVPQTIRDGGVLRPEYDKELQELLILQNDSNSLLSALETQELESSGIKNLRMAYNQVHGFYLEIPRSYQGEIPAHWRRMQTLKNAERYQTPALRELEEKVAKASALALQREKELYLDLLQQLSAFAEDFYLAGQAIAEIDVFSAWAELAEERNYCRPELSIKPEINLKAGRHPVVEQSGLDYFVPNDLQLNAKKRFLLITGANMGGKSTYMRQSALIVIMAQAGCFVPASTAKIGIFNSIFTRIGASDDLANARSTFMVEMNETAAILHQADENSLVIVDEIGRGTSTFDGLSLAWATASQLLNVNRCLTMFATHYFELTELGEKRGAANIHLRAIEHQNEIVFLHEVQNGAANQSYGIQVAKLAGLPPEVIHIAQLKLRELENRGANSLINRDLFAEEALPREDLSFITDFLRQQDLDDLSPRQALNLLQTWQNNLKK